MTVFMRRFLRPALELQAASNTWLYFDDLKLGTRVDAPGSELEEGAGAYLVVYCRQRRYTRLHEPGNDACPPQDPGAASGGAAPPTSKPSQLASAG